MVESGRIYQVETTLSSRNDVIKSKRRDRVKPRSSKSVRNRNMQCYYQELSSFEWNSH